MENGLIAWSFMEKVVYGDWSNCLVINETVVYGNLGNCLVISGEVVYEVWVKDRL